MRFEACMRNPEGYWGYASEYAEVTEKSPIGSLETKEGEYYTLVWQGHEDVAVSGYILEDGQLWGRDENIVKACKSPEVWRIEYLRPE